MSTRAPIVDALADWFAAQAPMVARLRERVPQVTVLEAADLETLKSAPPPAPSVHLLHHDDSRASDAGAQGKVADIRQTWLAVVCVRNVRAIRTGEGVRADAGGLVVAVARALMGWSPTGGFAPLELVAAPYRTTYRDGRLYVPLAFATNFRLTSY